MMPGAMQRPHPSPPQQVGRKQPEFTLSPAPLPLDRTLNHGLDGSSGL